MELPGLVTIKVLRFDVDELAMIPQTGSSYPEVSPSSSQLRVY